MIETELYNKYSETCKMLSQQSERVFQVK